MHKVRLHLDGRTCCYIFCHAVSTDETSYEAGIKVQIHTQDEPPFIDQLGFGVAPGFQTFVSCQQQLVPNDQHLFFLFFVPELLQASVRYICVIVHGAKSDPSFSLFEKELS